MKPNRIAYIGVGLMGLPMVKRLLSLGYAVTAYDVLPRQEDSTEDGMRRTSVEARYLPPHIAARWKAGEDRARVIAEQLQLPIYATRGTAQAIAGAGIEVTAVNKVAEGGMATVYEAEQLSLARQRGVPVGKAHDAAFVCLARRGRDLRARYARAGRERAHRERGERARDLPRLQALFDAIGRYRGRVEAQAPGRVP